MKYQDAWDGRWRAGEVLELCWKAGDLSAGYRRDVTQVVGHTHFNVGLTQRQVDVLAL